MSKCRQLHKFHYKIKMAELAVNHTKAVSEALTHPPPIGFVMAAAIVKITEIEMKKLRVAFVSGPICGASPIRNGMVDYSIKY